MKSSHSLIIVGFGIKFVSHLTVETKTYIEKADKVLYLVNNPAVKEWIKEHNTDSESLDALYQSYTLRPDSYRAISDYILENLKKGQHVCVVFYGHPAVFAQPGITAVTEARKAGYDARILPAISAEDCLFADLLVNPGSCGCQSFEATDFLIYLRPFSIHTHLILWQVGFIGAIDHPKAHDNTIGIKVLQDYLLKQYPADHPIILYEAAQYPTFEPRLERLALNELSNANINAITTLYLAPIDKVKPDQDMLAALKIPPTLLKI